MISENPFIVDRWYEFRRGECRKQRYRYPTRERAENMAQSYLEMDDTMRIRLSKDSEFSNRPTVIKVWTKRGKEPGAQRHRAARHPIIRSLLFSSSSPSSERSGPHIPLFRTRNHEHPPGGTPRDT